MLLEQIKTAELKAEFVRLQEQAETWLRKQQAELLTETSLLYLLDARYKGQAYEIELLVSPEYLEGKSTREIADSFHLLHEKQYGHSDEKASIELMNMRVRIIGKTPKPPGGKGGRSELPEAEPVSQRKIIIKGGIYQAAVYRRSDLRCGQRLNGPAIVEQDDTTTLILPNWSGKTDHAGNLIIERKES